jgi:Mrp family chromosome partitioning ATPase
MAMFDGFIQAQTQVMTGREVIDAALKTDAWQKLATTSTAEQFASSLKVETRPRSDFLQVKYTHANPQAATIGVQSVIGGYKDVFNRDQEKSEVARMGVLQQRRTELQAQATMLQARIDGTLRGRTLAEIDPLFNETSDRLRKLRAALTDIQIAIAGGPGLSLDGPVRSAASDTTSVRQWAAARIFKLECELVEARAKGAQDSHPSVIRLTTLIKAYREQVATLPAEAEEAAPDPAIAAASRKPLQERETNLREMVQAAQAELNQLATERAQLKRMDTESESLRQQLADTETRLDALTTESSTGGRLAIVSGGDRPVTAVQDNRAKMGAAGALAGACTPFGVLMLATLVRRRYRTGEELAEDLIDQVPFVTVVPQIGTEAAASGLAARCIHAARSRLTQGAGASRIYMVSSAGQGDGKSCVAMSLGLSLAASGLRTLIIDADLTSRQLTQALNAKDSDGLLEALNNNAEPALNHLRAGPWVLTSGRSTSRDAGRLRPEAIRTLLTGLRSRFDVIIVDTDSLLSGVTAPVLAPHTDGIILTVAAGARQQHVHNAARQARQLGSVLAAAVFNKADLAQFPPELRADSELTQHRTLPQGAAAFGPLVGAVLESLSLTREDDLRLAPAGIDLASSNRTTDEEQNEAQRRQQDRSAA